MNCCSCICPAMCDCLCQECESICKAWSVKLNAWIMDRRMEQYEKHPNNLHRVVVSIPISDHDCTAAVGHLCPVCEPF